jgi:hypothetical protein
MKEKIKMEGRKEGRRKEGRKEGRKWLTKPS